MSSAVKFRDRVEIWFRKGPGLPLSECLCGLEPSSYQIRLTSLPVLEVGDSPIELTRLVLLLAPPGGGPGAPRAHDLIVVPGMPHVFLLFKYAVYPSFDGRQLLPLGGHRYALNLGAFLSHGQHHPCYCSIPAGTRLDVEIRQSRSDLFESDRLSR